MTGSPSIFGNMNLSSGLKKLANLEFDKAIPEFQFAKGQSEDLETVSLAINAAYYWKERVENLEQKKSIGKDVLNSFWNDYQKYTFSVRIYDFKKKLLQHFSDYILKEKDADEDLIEAVFEQFRKEKMFDNAEKFIGDYSEKHAEQSKWLYFLAQAEWENNKKSQAKKHYLQAILYYPKEEMLSYVSFSELKNLAKKYPLELVPAYARIFDVFSFVKIKEDLLHPLNLAHSNALKVYHLLEDCYNASEQKANPLTFRKRLQKTDPDVFQSYMDSISASSTK